MDEYDPLQVKSGYLDALFNQLQASKKRQQTQADLAAHLLSSPTTGPTGNAGMQGQQGITSAPGGNVGQWIQQAAQAMGRQFSPQEVAALTTMIQKESGGNPNAINRWDSNAKAGHPSQGLMQTIPSTFKQYALPGYNSNITDPVSNIIAGARYALARYGSLTNVPGIRSMNSGGAYRGY